MSDSRKKVKWNETSQRTVWFDLSGLYWSLILVIKPVTCPKYLFYSYLNRFFSFSEASHKMVKCIIRGCCSTNNKGRSAYVPLISIPKNDRKLWEAALKMTLPKDARVCTPSKRKRINPAGAPPRAKAIKQSKSVNPAGAPPRAKAMKQSKSASPAGISMVSSGTGVVQSVERDLSKVGEPLMKKRKVVILSRDPFEMEQENLVVLKSKDNARCYSRVRKPLIQVNESKNVVPHQ